MKNNNLQIINTNLDKVVNITNNAAEIVSYMATIAGILGKVYFDVTKRYDDYKKNRISNNTKEI